MTRITKTTPLPNVVMIAFTFSGAPVALTAMASAVLSIESVK